MEIRLNIVTTEPRVETDYAANVQSGDAIVLMYLDDHCYRLSSVKTYELAAELVKAADEAEIESGRP